MDLSKALQGTVEPGNVEVMHGSAYAERKRIFFLFLILFICFTFHLCNFYFAFYFVISPEYFLSICLTIVKSITILFKKKWSKLTDIVLLNYKYIQIYFTQERSY